ncbi:MAG: hypothetical protein FIB08_03035 [Candidatus Methanoperedens sp.]|nr:hypothetical protein [Candidatus Methanoperedens sp.]
MALFDGKFYDFYTHPAPGNGVALMAAVAKKYGYSGIAVTNPTANDQDIVDIADKTGDFSIFQVFEIPAKRAKLRDEIKKHKEDAGILIVKGADEYLTREAVETEGLDILLQPQKFNNVLAKIASDNSVTLGFNIGSIIHTRGEARVRELVLMRANLKHARKYGIQMILTCDSHSHYDIRSPREMAALSGLIGMTEKEAFDAMSTTPLGILRKKSPDYVQEGIEIL